MVTRFADFTAVKNDNLVGIADRRKTVCNDEGGSALHELNHSFLNTHFRAGIDTGGCFVKNENLGIGKDGSRNGEELSLTVTDIAAYATVILKPTALVIFYSPSKLATLTQ